MPSSETTEYLKINPIEELLKAIEIVHGVPRANYLRYVVARIMEEEEKRKNRAPWTVDGIQEIVNAEVKYKDWKFIIQKRDIWENGGWDYEFRLRAEFMAPDAETGIMEKQASRWWIISKHAVKTEIINTAFFCVKTAEEHELRETFKYKTAAVYNTHIDADTLAQMATDVDVRVDTRPDAPKNQRRE